MTMNDVSRYSRAKIFLGGLLFRPLLGRLIYQFYRGLIPYHGFSFCLDLGITPPYQEVARLYFGYYEKAEREFVLRFLKSDLDVVELGAGIGVISSFVHGKIADNHQHICVEGNPMAIDKLTANVKRNFPEKKLPTIIHAAISYTSTDKVHFHVDENILGSSVSRAGLSSLEVPTTTLSKVFTEAVLGSFALVCDIEGAEAGILLRDAEVLKHCRQIIIELHSAEFEGQKYSVSNLDSMITRLGFRKVVSHGHTFMYTAEGV